MADTVDTTTTDDASTTTVDEPVHDAMPPELLPDPFSGSTDLDSSGDVITCPSNGMQGPVPADGQDKYMAWNTRAGADADATEDPAAMPDPTPDETMAATANVTKAKAAYIALNAKFSAFHARVKNTAKLNKQIQAELNRSRLSNIAAIRDKVSAETKLKAVTAERDQLATDKKSEPSRINAEAQRMLAADGRPPLKAEIDTQGKVTGAKTVAASSLTGLDRAIAAHKAAAENPSNN